MLKTRKAEGRGREGSGNARGGWTISRCIIRCVCTYLVSASQSGDGALLTLCWRLKGQV